MERCVCNPGERSRFQERSVAVPSISYTHGPQHHPSVDLDQKAQEQWNNMSGLSETERDEFDAILNPNDNKYCKFVDAWRHLHPDADQFT